MSPALSKTLQIFLIFTSMVRTGGGEGDDRARGEGEVVTGHTAVSEGEEGEKAMIEREGRGKW